MSEPVIIAVSHFVSMLFMYIAMIVFGRLDVKGRQRVTVYTNLIHRIDNSKHITVYYAGFFIICILIGIFFGVLSFYIMKFLF